MKEIWVQLSSAKDVQRFVATLVPLPGDFELVSNECVLDARSLMGIFGFDLSRPLCLRIYQNTTNTLAALKPFQVHQKENHHEQ